MGCNDQNATAVAGSAGVDSAGRASGGICRVNPANPDGSANVYANVLTNEAGVILDAVPPALVSDLQSHGDAVQLMQRFHGIELGTSHADAMGIRNMQLIPAVDSQGREMNWTQADLEFMRTAMEGSGTQAGHNNVVLSVNDARTGVIAVNFANGNREGIKRMILALRASSDTRYRFAAETLSRNYVQTWPVAAGGDPDFESYVRVDHMAREIILLAVGALVGIGVFAVGGLLSHILTRRYDNRRGGGGPPTSGGTPVASGPAPAPAPSPQVAPPAAQRVMDPIALLEQTTALSLQGSPVVSGGLQTWSPRAALPSAQGATVGVNPGVVGGTITAPAFSPAAAPAFAVP